MLNPAFKPEDTGILDTHQELRCEKQNSVDEVLVLEELQNIDGNGEPAEAGL